MRLVVRSLVAALLTVAACQSASRHADSQSAAAKPSRRFVQLNGTVRLDGKPARLTDSIGAAAKVETGADGHAVMTLTPGNVVEVRPGTTVELGKSARKELSLRLASGALWSLLPSGASYEVVTSQAVAGVRGTTFYTEARADGTTYLCACSGDVQLGGPPGSTFSQAVSSPNHDHKSFILTSSAGTTQAATTTRQNHTDVQGEVLESLRAATRN